MAGCYPGERLRSLGPGHLDESRLRGELAEQSDQVILVLGELVHVVSRQDRGRLAVDQPPQLAQRDHVPIDVLAIERHQCIGGRIAPDVTALHVDAENDGVECVRAGTHMHRWRARRINPVAALPP